MKSVFIFSFLRLLWMICANPEPDEVHMLRTLTQDRLQARHQGRGHSLFARTTPLRIKTSAGEPQSSSVAPSFSPLSPQSRGSSSPRLQGPSSSRPQGPSSPKSQGPSLPQSYGASSSSPRPQDLPSSSSSQRHPPSSLEGSSQPGPQGHASLGSATRASRPHSQTSATGANTQGHNLDNRVVEIVTDRRSTSAKAVAGAVVSAGALAAVAGATDWSNPDQAAAGAAGLACVGAIAAAGACYAANKLRFPSYTIRESRTNIATASRNLPNIVRR